MLLIRELLKFILEIKLIFFTLLLEHLVDLTKFLLDFKLILIHFLAVILLVLTLHLFDYLLGGLFDLVQYLVGEVDNLPSQTLILGDLAVDLGLQLEQQLQSDLPLLVQILELTLHLLLLFLQPLINLLVTIHQCLHLANVLSLALKVLLIHLLHFRNTLVNRQYLIIYLPLQIINHFLRLNTFIHKFKIFKLLLEISFT